jgi:FtsH-binding integral membrane protein
MLNALFRTWLVAGLWFAALAVIVASSVAMDAKLSTTALLLIVGVAPAILVLFIGRSGQSATVAEILHTVEAQDGRS